MTSGWPRPTLSHFIPPPGQLTYLMQYHCVSIGCGKKAKLGLMRASHFNLVKLTFFIVWHTVKAAFSSVCHICARHKHINSVLQS